MCVCVSRRTSSGLALCVEQTGPVLGFESLLQVPVDENLNVVSLGSNGEGGNFLWGCEVAQDERTKDRGKWAPVTHHVASVEAESRLVERAHNRRAFSESAILQGRSKVRAAIGNGKDFAIKISSNQKSKAVHLDGNKVACSDILALEDCNPFLLLMHFFGNIVTSCMSF